MGSFQSTLLNLRSPFLVAPAAAVVLGLYAFGINGVAIITGGLLSIACFYHNLIWLYSKCDKLIGGLPTASHAYIVGFLSLMLGYVLLSWSFFLDSVTVWYLGGLALVLGLTLTVFATKTLFDRIFRGASLG